MYASMCLVNGMWDRLPVSALMLRQLAKGRLRFLLPGTTTPTSLVFYQPPSFSYYRFGTSVHFFARRRQDRHISALAPIPAVFQM